MEQTEVYVMNERRLSNVLFDLAMYGADRGALVRPAQGDKCAAVCVIMEGKTSLLELGKKIMARARFLGDAAIEHIDSRDRLKEIFELADQSPNGWAFSVLNFGKMEVTVAIFARDVEAIAEICTANGAPCSLDPKEVAPGWKLQPVRGK